MRIPTSTSIVRRSLRFFYRSHLAIALGIAAATSVVVGALVVGDSVRGSLRGLVLNRLANIECMLQARTFFQPTILQQLSLNGTEGEQVQIVPAIILSGSTVEHRNEQQRFRASRVQLLSTDQDFWAALRQPGGDTAGPSDDFNLADDQVALNASLAKELSVKVGDEISVRISSTPGVPADNPLGRRDDASVNLPRQTVIAILPDDGIGGVRFAAGQDAPRNVFASKATVQDILECGTQVNAAVILTNKPSMGGASQSADVPKGLAWCEELNRQLRPSVEDYGLQLTRHTRLFPDPEIDLPDPATQAEGHSSTLVFDYFQLSSTELIIDNETANSVVEALRDDGPMRLMTYLANGITKVSMSSDEAESTRDIGREVPYSIVVGVDSVGGGAFNLSPYTRLSADRSGRQPHCWINSWLADELSIEAGDWLQLKYFEPETVDGKEVELETRLLVVGIVPLTEPARPFARNRPAAFSTAPSIFNDPHLTPTVPGVTDQASISQWDMPFKLRDDLILSQDDEYWNNHRLTPKVFLPYRSASNFSMFGSRFGQTTAIRFEAQQVGSERQLREKLEEALLSTRSQKGLAFMPVRQTQLAAASGTTPFDLLFLSLSFFVIVAALLLVMLLLKLGIEKRAVQLGVFYAQGFTASRVRSLLMQEHFMVAIGGAGIGLVLGLGYARAMIAGLQSWWVGAISTPFLQFAFEWKSLAIGFIAGLVTSMITIYFGLSKLSRVAPLPLLRGRTGESLEGRRSANRVALAIAGFAAFGAVGMIILGLGQTGMARAGTFFGCGFLVLAALLIALRQWIAAGVGYGPATLGSLSALAWRAIRRNPVRSSLALGLLSVTSFLIASMGVFQVSPSQLGYGGFNLIAESSQPIYRNLASPTVRRETIGDAANKLLNTTVVPMRRREGEDASCNNLFQVAQPTILGVSPRLRDLTEISPETHKFSWAAARNRQNPWAGLQDSATGESFSPIPVILDQNTAAWSLKQGQSLGSIIQLNYNDRQLHFKTVGLLSNSVLQGKLVIGQANFEMLFPEISGYSYFLIRSGDSPTPMEVTEVFENGWSDEGLDVTYSDEVLTRMLGVQNTYISAFQSLGALGLLLGTFGLVAVQLRSVIERRKELALMRAVGFSERRIAAMLTLETGILLVVGMLVGILSATISLAPFVIETGPQLSLIGPLGLLCLVLIVGFVAAIIAVRSAAKQSVLQGLRSE